MRPATSAWGMPIQLKGVEEIQYQKLQFGSDAEANKYARIVLGINCFAVNLTE